MTDTYSITGVPQEGGVLIVVDHASNHIPEDIDLGIAMEYHADHIAFDIGVAEIARIMAENTSYLAIMSGVSRLVTDLNRYPDEDAVIPLRSDGVEIPGNVIDQKERFNRLENYFHPYHARVTQLIGDINPSLILSLHSFTPTLRTNPQLDRPWDMGILYGEYETASRLALQHLESEDLLVGDQLPYSGKELNATMNRQAEAVGKPYFGVEIRQDLIAHQPGQQRFADILLRTCEKVRSGLA